MDEPDILNVPQVTPEEVKDAMQGSKAAIILDVRTPQEYERNRIGGSINLPIDELPEKIAGVLPDKSALVYVYCLSGSRSAQAVSCMKDMGYLHVFDMPHGLLLWRIKGYPLEGPLTQPLQ